MTQSTALRSTPRRQARPVAVVLLAWLITVLVAQVSAAGPAAAHAELVASTPANGEQLREAPPEVALQFTEPVALVEGGLQLLDVEGQQLDAPPPVLAGSTVRWPMPTQLPDGAYVVSWRVVSGDGHPVSGAFAFGIGVAPDAVASAAPTVPWPVTTARVGGYLGFALIAGAVAFTWVCWPTGRGHRRMRTLLRSAAAIAVASTILGLLLQGPYAAGQPLTRLFDPALVGDTADTSYGAWTALRLVGYVFLAVVLWPRAALESGARRWLAAIGVVATAVTYSGTGHVASPGYIVDRALHSLHVLAAGVWVGGLVTLVLAATLPSERPTIVAFRSFSRVALFSVVALVATGTLNALLRLDTVAQMWQTDYGQVLTAKLVLVVAALGAAYLSRRRVRRSDAAWSTVRLEAAVVLAVLAVTAVLASTSPPSTLTAASVAPRAGATVAMDLGDGRTARVHVDGLGTNGSYLHLELLDRRGAPLRVDAARLQATLAARDLGPLEVALTSRPAGWFGDFTFPLPGRWTLTLTVEEESLGGLVTAGTLRIR